MLPLTVNGPVLRLPDHLLSHLPLLDQPVIVCASWRSLAHQTVVVLVRLFSSMSNLRSSRLAIAAISRGHDDLQAYMTFVICCNNASSKKPLPSSTCVCHLKAVAIAFSKLANAMCVNHSIIALTRNARMSSNQSVFSILVLPTKIPKP